MYSNKWLIHHRNPIKPVNINSTNKQVWSIMESTCFPGKLENG